MNKADLIHHIATETGMAKQSCAEALDAVLDGIKAGLANDGNVTLVGFGTFSIGERAARIGRNLRTGEEVEIAAARVPKFKAGSDLRAAVA